MRNDYKNNLEQDNNNDNNEGRYFNPQGNQRFNPQAGQTNQQKASQSFYGDANQSSQNQWYKNNNGQNYLSENERQPDFKSASYHGQPYQDSSLTNHSNNREREFYGNQSQSQADGYAGAAQSNRYYQNYDAKQPLNNSYDQHQWSQGQGYRADNFGSQNLSQGNRAGSSWGSDSYGSNYNDMSSRTGKFSGIGPKDYKRSDERIHEEACEKLARDSEINAANIDVQVKEGIITLAGTVDDRAMKRSAESCVEEVSGVKDVINNLRTQSNSLSNSNSDTITTKHSALSNEQKQKESSMNGKRSSIA